MNSTICSLTLACDLVLNFLHELYLAKKISFFEFEKHAQKKIEFLHNHLDQLQDECKQNELRYNLEQYIKIKSQDIYNL